MKRRRFLSLALVPLAALAAKLPAPRPSYLGYLTEIPWRVSRFAVWDRRLPNEVLRQLTA